MHAVNYQKPGNKYWLSAIKPVKQSVVAILYSTTLQRICREGVLMTAPNDGQVSNKRKETERYADGGQNDIVYEEGTVVAGNWHPLR